MSCPDPMLLHALLDDELDAANVASVEAHLRTCPDCAAEFEELKRLHQMIADPALQHAAPAGLRERIEAALPTAPRAANPWLGRLSWGAGGAIAAGLLVIRRRTSATPAPGAGAYDPDAAGAALEQG